MDVRKQALHIYSVFVIHFVLFSKLIDTVPYYTMDITYSNLKCPTVTSELGTARSELDCLVRCHKLGACHGFFYNVISQSCHGTTVSIATTAFCITMSGNIYYATTNDSVTTTPVTTSSVTTTLDTTSSVTSEIVSTISMTSNSASTASITSTPASTVSVTLTLGTVTTTMPAPASTSSVTSTPGSTTSSRSTTPFTTTVTTTTSTTSTTSTTTTPTITTSVTPTPTYGMPCFSSSDCLISYTECISDTCQCSPGYRLLPDSQTCTISCTSFGTSYIRLPDTVLDSPTITIHMGVSVAQCMSICSNLMFCSGFNYCNSCGGMCRSKTEPPVYDPSDWRSVDGVDHYSRNCD